LIKLCGPCRWLLMQSPLPRRRLMTQLLDRWMMKIDVVSAYQLPFNAFIAVADSHYELVA
jgi:hypothetical protein